MFTSTLIALATAIAVHEGWNPMGGGGVNLTEPTVAYRNHNPGNLRGSPFAVGIRDGFAVFLNDDIGFTALVWDIWSKCRGNTSTGLTGASTLQDLIFVYAPPVENDTVAYVEFIERRTGLSRTTLLATIIK